MGLRLYQQIFGYVIISIFIVITMSAMWNFSVDFSEKKSLIHGTFFSATKWLSENLEENQTALLPNTHVFWSIDDSLIKQTKDYQEVWELSGIILRANITDTEILNAQNHLRQYVNNNPELKYLVIDWVDAHGRKYFPLRSCEKFDENLLEIEKYELVYPSENWRGGIIICEIKNGL